MITRARKILSEQRKRLLPGLVALSLLAGIITSIVLTPNAQADYANGCGYGYSSSSGSTYGYGTGYGYGALSGVSGYGYGYGNTICSLSFSPTTLTSGTVGTSYSPQSLVGQGGVGPYTWALTSGSADGLLLSSSGTFTGTPTAGPGTYSFTVTMTDANAQTVPESVSVYIASGGGGGGNGGGGTTTSSTTTTAVPATTTTVPATTTTVHVSPKPKPKPKLVFMGVGGLAKDGHGVWLKFKCLSATCHARVSLSAILSVKHGRGSVKAYVVVALRNVPLAKNRSGSFFFNWRNTGRATLGGNNHYRNLGLRLTSTVIGGSRHQQIIHISK